MGTREGMMSCGNAAREIVRLGYESRKNAAIAEGKGRRWVPLL